MINCKFDALNSSLWDKFAKVWSNKREDIRFVNSVCFQVKHIYLIFENIDVQIELGIKVVLVSIVNRKVNSCLPFQEPSKWIVSVNNLVEF